VRRAAASVVLAACAVLVPGAAFARATVSLDGGSVVFFSDTLALIARDGATLTLADGTRAHADAAFVDLKTDRAVLAGHARLTRGSASMSADAIALELDSERVDLLDATSGVSRTTRRLGAPASAAFDADRFAFPDVDDRSAFIRSHHATITPHADVRFTPASFPTSVGGVPVPSYLYTYATGAGFGSTSLAGATFDQPYGLFGTPTSLTALHARWEDGVGPALALQSQIVSGDDAYVDASFDQPVHGYALHGFNAYRRLGARYTAEVDASGSIYGTVLHGGLTGAFGPAGARMDYTRTTGGGSSFTASVRTPDKPLFGGVTWRLTGSAGFDAQRGGLLTELPDAHDFATVWRKGLDFSVATPVWSVPLGIKLATTLDASRTWYSFPHTFDSLGSTVTASHEIIPRKLSLFAGYQATWTADVFPGNQGIFYPTPITPLILPDGTPFLGYAAFSGARTFRSQNVDLQITPDSNTAYRLSVVHTSDFPQFDGFGRPEWEVRGDVRFRPFPNIGLDIGRAYDFAWGGVRWQPRWSFAITP
jgi:hypothetical protein